MTAPALSLRGVMKQYAGEESPVLKDINLDVHAGEYVAIVGASGSGKSTLLNILGLLDTPSAGAFAILGSSTEHFTESDRNRYRREVLGFVLQSSNTIDDETCLRNVALAPQTQNLPIAQRWRVDRNALERVGLRHLAQQRTRTLSGGQRQRVAFARAIAAHPQILLADEPTGNLDTSSADRIMHLLKEAAERGVAVILVTHDLERARQADRVLQLRDGVLVEQSRSARAPGNLVRGRSDGPKTPETRTRKLWRSITDTLCDSLSSISLAPVRSLFLLLAFAVSVGGLFAASGIASSAGVQVAAQFAAAARDQVQVSFETDIISPGELDRIRGFQTRLAEVDEVSRVGFFITAKDVSVSRVGGKPDDSIRVLGATPEILQIYGAETQPGHAGELLASCCSS